MMCRDNYWQVTTTQLVEAGFEDVARNIEDFRTQSEELDRLKVTVRNIRRTCYTTIRELRKEDLTGIEIGTLRTAEDILRLIEPPCVRCGWIGPHHCDGSWVDNLNLTPDPDMGGVR